MILAGAQRIVCSAVAALLAATLLHATAAAPDGPSPSLAAPLALSPDVALLRGRALAVPVQGILASQLADTYTDPRGGGTGRHDAMDIHAPRGTPVVAVDDGRVTRLFLSTPGGITLYQFDPGGQFVYYYAHLDRYADGIREGQPLRKGQVIGYVGSTGNASPTAPHLHFAVLRLGPERRWWQGTPINPFLLWRENR